MFLTLYFAATVALISVVHFWPLMSGMAAQLRKASSPGASTGETVGKATGALPQFDTEEGETAGGVPHGEASRGAVRGACQESTLSDVDPR